MDKSVSSAGTAGQGSLPENVLPKNKEVNETGLSRREFLKTAAAGAVGVTAMGVLGSCAASPGSRESGVETGGAEARNTGELPFPRGVAPRKVTYESDVLVVGGGFAGLNAAVAAKNAGKSVVLVDKGHPGYSGLTPWPSSHRWFDSQFGDDPKAFRDCMMLGGEYILNLDWYQVWIDESKAMFEQLMDWGILKQYPRAADTGFTEGNRYVAYRETNAQNDRHLLWDKVLGDHGIETVDFTMITNVIKEGGRAVGAMGLHVPSGAVITFNAKAVVLAAGGGAYKPTGFPVGGVTFDAEYIGYQLGLPIAGKEFDDFHMTLSYAPGNAMPNNSWPWLENIWLCGGDVTPDTISEYAVGKSRAMVVDRITKANAGLSSVDGTEIEDQSTATVMRRGGTASTDPRDLRQGKRVSPLPRGDIYGAAVGMGSHLTNGIFCGINDLVGYTGLPGLYVAGDGCNASHVTGAMYPCGVGFTSSFVSIQGKRAGEAAAKYADTVAFIPIPAATVTGITGEIEAPLNLKTGFDPNWARDELQAIMSPFWINIIKSEASLNAALVQIEFLRDSVAPKLMARSSHSLRLCHEMKHKILSAEMKLRASLMRKESRGFHYRADFPFRDDKDFLCYITVQKQANGSMALTKVPVKDEWKGDLSKKYEERYIYRFPGETEAKKLPPERSGGR
jgi:succinate dehydrogenase/fumarate reductase flavoprotein subunit